MQHRIPVGPLHAHDQLIAGDAGIVHQDVDLAELRTGRLDRGLDLLFIGNVESEGRSLPARGGNFVNQFVQLLLITRGNGNRRARRGELQRAGSSNALRCAVTNATRPERDMRFSRVCVDSDCKRSMSERGIIRAD